MSLDDIINKRKSWLASFATHLVGGTRTLLGRTNACANLEVFLEHKDKSIILAGAHRSAEESVAIIQAIAQYAEHPIYAIMRDTLAKVGPFNFNRVLQACGGLPVKRPQDHEGPRKEYNRAITAYASTLLANGAYMLFYPQGTRRPNGLGPISDGAFKTLNHLQGNDPDVLILPFFVSFNQSSLWDRYPATVIHFGNPIHSGDYLSLDQLRSSWSSQMEAFFELERAKKLPLQKQ